MTVVNLSQSSPPQIEAVQAAVLRYLGTARPPELQWNPQPLVLALREVGGGVEQDLGLGEEEYLGGLIGETLWGYLHVRLLSVDKGLRGRGFGRQLMEAAHTEARQRGCHGAYLDTFSFQAPDFYQKLGYEIYGKLDDFPQGYCRYFLRRSLVHSKNQDSE